MPKPTNTAPHHNPQLGTSQLWIVPPPVTLEALTQYIGVNPQTQPNAQLITDDTSIKIATIRELHRELSTYAAQPRTVYIFPTERLLPASQQALLKLLEEPPQNTSIILIGSSTHSVLPTVASRCRITLFSTNSNAGQNIDASAGASSSLTHNASQTLWHEWSRAQTPREQMLLAQSLPTTKAALLELAEQELILTTTATRDQLADPQFAEFRTLLLEVINALKANVSPILCTHKLSIRRRP